MYIVQHIYIRAKLKGGTHGHFHIAFLVPMFSLGGAETQDSIFKIFRMHQSSKFAVKIMLECAL